MKSEKLIYGILIANVIFFLIFFLTHHYYPVVMFLHIVSLFILWGYVLVASKSGHLIKKHWKDALLIIALVLVGLVVRLYNIDEVTPGMYGDEMTVGGNSMILLTLPEWIPFDGTNLHGVYSHPTPLMYMTAHSINLFGYTPTAIRLPSIIFGALSIGVFYILLRLFLPLPFALFGGVLMLFQYTQVVLSRLAYEPPASLFYQILALIFFALYHRTKERIYLIGIALSVGSGMYTYLNFRPFALLMIALTVFVLIRSSWQKTWKHVCWFGSLCFVAAMPLINVMIIDSKGFFDRMSEISIFSRHYTPSEFIKELVGNMYRTAAIPFIGDPNPGKNPAGTTLFDPLTFLLAVVGLIFLFRKNRFWFWISLLLFLPPFVSDIFSTEVIPEFHYYGLGHPNALRVSGFIVVILFLAVYGVWWMYRAWGKKKYLESMTAGTILLLIVSFWNWHWYFNQLSINPEWYLYNYKFNDAHEQRLISSLTQKDGKIIAMDRKTAASVRINFFLSSTKTIRGFDATATQSAVQAIQTSDATVIAVSPETVPVINTLGQKDVLTSQGYQLQVQSDPLRQPEYVIIERRNPQNSLDPALFGL